MQTAIPRRAPVSAWQAYLGATLALTVAYPLLPDRAHNAVYLAIGCSAVLAIVASIVWNGAPKLGSWLIAAGLAAWTIGDSLFTVVYDTRFPTPADGFYLAFYPLVVAGIVVLMREPGRRAGVALLDTAIVTIPLALGLWVAFIQPLASNPAEPAVTRAVSSAYPLADGVVLALLLSLLLRPVARRAAYWLLILAVTALISTDLVYDELLTYRHYVAGSWVDCGWLLMYALFGAAALHPSRMLGEERRGDHALGSRRLALLATASVAASALVLVSWAEGRIGLPVVAVAAAMVPLLILGRLAVLVTEHRKAGSQARYLAAIVQGSDDAIIGVDLGARVTNWNPAAERMFGYTVDEAVGRPIWKLYAPGLEELVRAKLARITDGEPIERFEGTRSRKDGTELDVCVTLSPVHDEGGRIVGMSAILHDITEHRLLEQRLRAAQRMEAVGRLAGGIAHDFNNMLTAILGHTDFISDTFDERDERQRHADRIRIAAEQASELTRQLLAFSRRQVLREQTLDLNTLVTDTHRSLADGADIAIDLHPDLGSVKADPNEVERVLANLVANAREAMSGGGRVAIATRNVELDEAFAAEHVGAPVGTFVELSIADTGVGMDDAVLERVFEPFFTTKPEGDTTGAGLGLSTVYGIVKQSNGYVSAESTPGTGSVFRVFLPRIDEVPAPAPDPRTAVPAGPASVLLVEDELIVRELMHDMLLHVGFDVEATGDPEHALEIASDDRTIDLVITDLVMPGMNGRRLAELLEQIRPGTPVLFTSGYAGDETVRAGVLGEGRRFLPKPFTVDELAHAARTLLAARGHGERPRPVAPTYTN